MKRAAGVALWLTYTFSSSAADLLHKPELLAEGHWTSDILLTDSRVAYNQVATNFEWTVGLAYGSIDLEYRPFRRLDAVTDAAELQRHRYAADIELRAPISDRLALLFSGNYYDGFNDYRTAWLDEYYRQFFEGIAGYKKAHPQGYNAGAGARWEYLSATGFLEASVSYAEDDVSPGYEIIPDPVFHIRRSPGSINKVGVAISSENVIAPFLRILNEVAISDSSGRDPRLNYQLSANIAAGQHWVFRAHGGYSREEPQFKAWYAGVNAEYDLTAALQVFLRAAYYHDTGEVLDSLAISGAPPAIETCQFGVGFRYSWPGMTLQLYGGPYLTRYGDIAAGTMLFRNLYRDRNWGIAQLALSMQF